MPDWVSYKDLLAGNRLKDNDVVQVTEIPGLLPSDRIGFALKLSGITWWKGLQSGSRIVLCQCQDSQSYAATNIALADFQRNGLWLYKAKTFGIHWAAYDVNDAKDWMKGAHSYLFTWSQD